jgi:hypothetical protein
MDLVDGVTRPLLVLCLLRRDENGVAAQSLALFDKEAALEIGSEAENCLGHQFIRFRTHIAGTNRRRKGLARWSLAVFRWGRRHEVVRHASDVLA